jgi:hypothetical protein
MNYFEELLNPANWPDLKKREKEERERDLKELEAVVKWLETKEGPKPLWFL